MDFLKAASGIAALLAWAGVGCASERPIAELVEERNYAGAVCAATTTGTAEDREALRAALEPRLAVRFAATALRAERLPEALRTAFERVRPRRAIVRVRTTWNDSLHARVEMGLAVRAGGRDLSPLGETCAELAAGLADADALCGPAHPRTGGSPMTLVELSLGPILDLATAGRYGITARALQPNGPRDAGDLREGERLARALATRSGGAERSWSERALVWERPPGEAAADLQVRAWYRVEAYCASRGTGTIAEEAVVPLPPGPSLEARVEALFAGGEVGFEALAARGRRARGM